MLFSACYAIEVLPKAIAYSALYELILLSVIGVNQISANPSVLSYLGEPHEQQRSEWFPIKVVALTMVVLASGFQLFKTLAISRNKIFIKKPIID
jgi:hypothetical protein